MDDQAINQEKLAKQFPNYSYLDQNAVIEGTTVIHFDYDYTKKGYHLFHSVAIMEQKDELSVLYESIDLLRLAKNLKKPEQTEFDWSKLDLVKPVYYNKYFTPQVLDSIALEVENITESFMYTFKPDNLMLSIAVIKDSAVTGLRADLTKLKANEAVDVEDALSKSATKLLETHLGYYNYEIEIQKKENDMLFLKKGNLALYFLKKKKLLFVVEDETLFNEYLSEITLRFFMENLIPKIEDKIND